MEKSFRDILSQFLEENAPADVDSPSKNTVRASVEIPEMHFTWTAPASMTAARKHSYRVQKTSQTSTPAPDAPAVEPKVESVEHLISLAQLSEADRHWVKILIALGAAELTEGLSSTRLKKAHRRLAKRLHPDMMQNASARERDERQKQFLIAQTTYEKLCRALPAYTAAPESSAA